MKRSVIKIDEEKCDGCGLCATACAEGAIEIQDGKARLISEKYCDGLGACLGECPQGAIMIEEREAESFEGPAPAIRADVACECHSNPVSHSDVAQSASPSPSPSASASTLCHWPVQLALISPSTPFLNQADLLLAADCVPFAYADFHKDLLAGKKVLVGCPKLDNAGAYIEKLSKIFANNEIKSLTIAHMEVPCCFGLNYIAQEAMTLAGLKLPVSQLTIGVRGEITDSTTSQ